MTCPISNQIAIHCDEPEQISAEEYLDLLIEHDAASIGGITYQTYEITALIDQESKEEAFQLVLTGDTATLVKLYIDEIARLME